MRRTYMTSSQAVLGYGAWRLIDAQYLARVSEQSASNCHVQVSAPSRTQLNGPSFRPPEHRVKMEYLVHGSDTAVI